MTAADWALVALGFLALCVVVALLLGAAMRGTDRPQPERQNEEATS